MGTESNLKRNNEICERTFIVFYAPHFFNISKTKFILQIVIDQNFVQSRSNVDISAPQTSRPDRQFLNSRDE